MQSFNRAGALIDKYEPLTEDPLNIPAGEYRFLYDYPISKEVYIPHNLTEKSSIIDVLLIAKEDYEKIYKIDNEECIDPNDAPFGIWGHHLGDLYFEGIAVNTKNNVIGFYMGS